MVLIAVALVGVPAMAETDEQVLTVNEAILSALAHSSDVAMAKFAVLEAEIALKEAEIDQLAGRPVSELEEAQRGLVDARVAFVDVLNDVALQVQQAYRQVVHTAELGEVQRKDHEQTERQLLVAKTRFDAGLIAQHEVDEVQLQADQSASDTAMSQVRHEDALWEFAMLVGNDRAAVDPDEIESGFVPFDLSLDVALKDALATRREIATARRAVDAAALRLELGKKTFAPPVEITRLEMNLERAFINLAKAETAVIVDVRAAYYSLKNAETAVDFQQRKRDLARRQRDIVQARYDAGMIALSDLVAAERNATQQELEVATAVWQYNSLRVALLQKIGRSELPPIPADIEAFMAPWDD